MFIKCRTDRGIKRKINEDYVLTVKGTNYVLLIVADGMGGQNAGEIASSMAAMTIRSFVFDEFMSYDDKQDLLREAIVRANNKIYKTASQNVEMAGMGTTVTCILICGDSLYYGHVGDSRAYVINNDSIRKITQDHSLVQELIDNGTITEAEAIEHPQRNLITRAVGTEKYVIVDTGIEKLNSDDKVLLCSDGLTSYLTDEEIHSFVKSDAFGAVDKMISCANDRGGKDNISIILAGREEE